MSCQAIGSNLTTVNRAQKLTVNTDGTKDSIQSAFAHALAHAQS